MRLVKRNESKKHGCLYCLDSEKSSKRIADVDGRCLYFFCPYDECRYKEQLEHIDDYEKYHRRLERTDYRESMRTLGKLWSRLQ